MIADNPEYDETQIAILNAVISCAAQYGFAGLTTRRIAETAGVNEVTIFRRFGNKSEVIKAAFRREAEFVKAEAIQYTGNLEDDLQRIIEALWAAANRRRAIFPLILAELPRNPELQDAAQHAFQAVAQITGLIAQYQEQGRLQSEPPLITFSALIGPLVFMLLLGDAAQETIQQFDLQDYVRRFLAGHG
jgi:AcrR family transcriptional regulator